MQMRSRATSVRPPPPPPHLDGKDEGKRNECALAAAELLERHGLAAARERDADLDARVLLERTAALCTAPRCRTAAAVFLVLLGARCCRRCGPGKPLLHHQLSAPTCRRWRRRRS